MRRIPALMGVIPACLVLIGGLVSQPPLRPWAIAHGAPAMLLPELVMHQGVSLASLGAAVCALVAGRGAMAGVCCGAAAMAALLSIPEPAAAGVLPAANALLLAGAALLLALAPARWFGPRAARCASGALLLAGFAGCAWAVLPASVPLGLMPLSPIVPAALLLLAVALQAVRWPVVGRPARTLEQMSTDPAYDRSLTALHALGEVFDDGIATVDPDGKLVVFNAGLQALYGFSDKPLLGHASAERLAIASATGKKMAWTKTPLARALRGEVLKDVDIRFFTGDAPDRETLVSARPVAGPRGRIEGAVMRVKDVTAARALEQAHRQHVARLEETSTELQRVAFVAAHHLQEPVRGISGYAQLLQRKTKDVPDAQEYVGYLMQESQRIKALVLDLLRFLEVPPRATGVKKTALQPLLERARVAVVKAAGAELTLMHDTLPELPVDGALLGRALEAVLDNALKFNESSLPTVSVSVRSDDAYIVLVFRDNGIGVPEDQAARDKLFELFGQHHNIGDYPGSGAGLAVARKILRAHGGDVRFGEPVDEGAIVEIHLPRQPGAVLAG